LDRGLSAIDTITRRKRHEVDYRSSKAIDAWGTSKPLAAWERDRRAKVNAGSIARRIRRGWNSEDAIATLVYGKPR